jgi:hypothetical protein
LFQHLQFISCLACGKVTHAYRRSQITALYRFSLEVAGRKDSSFGTETWQICLELNAIHFVKEKTFLEMARISVYPHILSEEMFSTFPLNFK